MSFDNSASAWVLQMCDTCPHIAKCQLSKRRFTRLSIIQHTRIDFITYQLKLRSGCMFLLYISWNMKATCGLGKPRSIIVNLEIYFVYLTVTISHKVNLTTFHNFITRYESGYRFKIDLQPYRYHLHKFYSSILKRNYSLIRLTISGVLCQKGYHEQGKVITSQRYCSM